MTAEPWTPTPAQVARVVALLRPHLPAIAAAQAKKPTRKTA